MKTDIGIWQTDPTSRARSKLDLTGRVETEEMLEAVLVANPEMLMRGLTLVGRQVPVATGFVDLLGIDGDGRLVVFEDGIERIGDSTNGTEARGENPSGPYGWSWSVSGSMRALTEWSPIWRTEVSTSGC